MPTSYLFLLSVGPVQSFISQARKTRDLFAASKLLSDLTWVGVKQFLKPEKPDDKVNYTVVFPYVTDATHKPAALPNRFLGKVTGAASTTLPGIGEAVEKAIRTYWDQQAEKVLETLFDTLPDSTYWKPQMTQHLEVFWLFVPIDDDSQEAYRTAHDRINQLLGAIKHERSFSQLIERGRKCLLDGERNALFYRPTETGGIPALLDQNEGIEAVTNANRYELYPGEALSTVSLLKRFYSGADFPATAEIATFMTLRTMEDEPAWKDYRALFANWDEQLLYADNLHETYLRNQGYTALIEKLPLIQATHKQFVAACRQQQLRLGKYYALLVFDGDGAGEWIAGQHLPAGQHLQTFHEVVASQLSKYAHLANRYLQKPRGRTVFAGGDDFIGFINLDQLFVVMAHLRKLFEELVSQPLQQQFSIVVPFTFSAGIVIAHYKEPLGEVIRAARSMEHKSKDYPGKNAFTVAIIRRSDHVDSSLITLPWSLPPGDKTSSITLLRNIVEALQARAANGQRLKPLFSNTFISKLHQTYYQLGEDADRNVLFPLIRYYVSRAYQGPKNEKQQHLETLMANLTPLWNCTEPATFGLALDCLDFISKHLNPRPIHD